MDFAFSACRYLSHHYPSSNFCFLYIRGYRLRMFRQNLFPVGFKFRLSPPLDFYRLHIPGDQTKNLRLVIAAYLLYRFKHLYMLISHVVSPSLTEKSIYTAYSTQ